MYEELIQSLREKAEFLTVSDVQKAPPGLNIKNLFAETMSEAADAIEAMRDLVATYEGQQRWIPVTERLPERGQFVLAAIYGTDMIVQEDGESLEDAVRRARSGPGRVEMGYLDEDGYWTETAFGSPMVVMPQYWMSVPEPPKEEDDG